MNASHLNEEPISLKQAVEEQLDLILKLEQDRKALKKQNKLLTHKLSNLSDIAVKYQVQTKDCQMNTEKEVQKIPQMSSRGIQIQLENEINLNNVSKLSEAKSFLKGLEQSKCDIEQKSQNPIKVIEKVEKQEPVQKQKTGNRQISDQLVKMSKEINSLRRQVKESEHKLKGKEKEIKDLKKCLQTKNQALEKVRKDFNELSIIFNTDKYKSVRTLENQVATLKVKLEKQEKQEKLKKVLEDLTQQYQEYRQQTANKISILVNQLASKEQENESLLVENKKLKVKVNQN